MSKPSCSLWLYRIGDWLAIPNLHCTAAWERHSSRGGRSRSESVSSGNREKWYHLSLKSSSGSFCPRMHGLCCLGTTAASARCLCGCLSNPGTSKCGWSLLKLHLVRSCCPGLSLCSNASGHCRYTRLSEGILNCLGVKFLAQKQISHLPSFLLSSLSNSSGISSLYNKEFLAPQEFRVRSRLVRCEHFSRFLWEYRSHFLIISDI